MFAITLILIAFVRVLKTKLKKAPTTPFFLFFFVSKREEEKAKEVLFFQSGSLRGSSVSGVPFRINEKQ